MFTTFFAGIAILVMASGTAAHDVLSLIDAEEYFKARHLEATAAKLVELAERDPREAKNQVAQLLALRWLGEHPDQLRATAGARAALEAIAAGKKAQDPEGFARDYAQRALALLEGKSPTGPVLGDASMRTDAVASIPLGVALVGGFDLRPPADVRPADEGPMRSLFQAITPPLERESIYQFAESVGNIRLDRVVVGYQAHTQDRRKTRIFVRFTGRANRKRLADLIGPAMGHAPPFKEEKDSSGKPMIVIAGNNPPALALVGDSDLLMCGYEDNAGSHIDVLRESLRVWSSGLPSVLGGPPLAQALGALPARAGGFFVGELPEELRKEIAAVVPAAPRRVNSDFVKGRGLVIHLQAEFDSGDEAKSFVEAMSERLRQASNFLRNLPPEIKVKPDALRQLTRTLESIRPVATGKTVRATLQLSPEALRIVEHTASETLKNYAEMERRGRPR